MSFRRATGVAQFFGASKGPGQRGQVLSPPERVHSISQSSLRFFV
jgi:hypothetical protein